MTGWSFEARIARAVELAKSYSAAREVLNFYASLARLQKTVFDALNGSGRTDLDSLLPYFDPLLENVRQSGTRLLIDFAAVTLSSAEAQKQVLAAGWEGVDPQSEAGRFYGRVLLQPYAEYLATRGQVVIEAASSQCPFCSHAPVCGVLRGEGDGAKRSLLCSMCSTEWPFRRVVCPNCGAEDKEKLPLYSAREFPHVRVDACDVCQTYIKSVDLTTDGHAVAIVDELASVPLNIWAEEHGYAKLEPNLLGF